MIYEEMKKLVDNNILLFLDSLAVSHNIPKETLFQTWNDFNSKTETLVTKPVTEKKVVKKSGYQNFFSKKRIEIKESNPSISFADLSKQISSEWNSLNINEKNKFINDVIPPPKIMLTLDELNGKKMSELKELCEKYGIKKSGNKTELIKNLMGKNEKSKEPIKSKITLPEIDKIDHSLDIYVSSKTEKRSDFETTEGNEEEDEFDNLSDKFADSESEATLEDDEEEDDEDPFDEE